MLSNCVPCRTNTSSALQTRQGEQPVSASQLADSLLAQLGHLPSKLNTSGSLVAVTSPGGPPKSGSPEVQLSHHRRNHSTAEQYHFVRPSSEAAAAAQRLRTSGCFSMQFLEPPNSQAPSGQLVYPSLPGRLSDARRSLGAASDKSGLGSLASMPHNSSLIKAGGPMINTNGVSDQLTACRRSRAAETHATDT